MLDGDERHAISTTAPHARTRRARDRGAVLPPRPEAIRFALAVTAAGVSAAGRAGARPLDLAGRPVAFAGEAWSGLDDALPLVDRGQFAPAARTRPRCSGPGSSRRPTTSRPTAGRPRSERFDEDALHLATRLLLSDDEACRQSLAEAVRRELMWFVPGDRAVDIRIRRPDVTVTLGAAAEAPS